MIVIDRKPHNKNIDLSICFQKIALNLNILFMFCYYKVQRQKYVFMGE